MHNKLSIYRYQVLDVQPLNEKTSQIFLLAEVLQNTLRYEAGQYVHLLFEDELFAPLSIASAPRHDQILEFHLYHPRYNTKALYLLENAHQKNCFKLAGPFGDCTLAKYKLNKPIIFLAWGSGFAPIKALIEALNARGSSLPIYFYWALSSPQELYLQQLLTQWQQNPNFYFRPLFTHDKPTMVLWDLVLANHNDFSTFQVYAAGPKPLVRSAYNAFTNAGLTKDSFYSDV